MREVIIPEGKCVFHNISIGYLDSSLCGIETVISVQGLVCVNGEVAHFVHEEQDVSLQSFLSENRDCTFYAYGSVHIFDELNYVDVSVAPINFDKCKMLFPEIADVQLPLESYLSDVYDKMREGYDLKDWTSRADAD